MFIEATNQKGEKFLVNLNLVSAVGVFNKETHFFIMDGEQPLTVKENYEEMKKLIKEAINEKV